MCVTLKKGITLIWVIYNGPASDKLLECSHTLTAAPSVTLITSSALRFKHLAGAFS